MRQLGVIIVCTWAAENYCADMSRRFDINHPHTRWCLNHRRQKYYSNIGSNDKKKHKTDALISFTDITRTPILFSPHLSIYFFFFPCFTSIFSSAHSTLECSAPASATRIFNNTVDGFGLILQSFVTIFYRREQNKVKYNAFEAIKSKHFISTDKPYSLSAYFVLNVSLLFCRLMLRLISTALADYSIFISMFVFFFSFIFDDGISQWNPSYHHTFNVYRRKRKKNKSNKAMYSCRLSDASNNKKIIIKRKTHSYTALQRSTTHKLHFPHTQIAKYSKPFSFSK